MKKNLPILLIYIPLISLLIIEFFHPLYAINQDLGRHLALGKIILQTWHVPTVNLFSYTYPNFPFINTHWLSEIVFYLLAQNFGFAGLLTTMTIIVIATFSLLFWETKKSSFLATTTVFLLATGVIFERTDLRPEIFSNFFLTIFIVILFKNREKATKWLFLLPLLQLLWVNMHIYFILGPVVMGFFLLDRLITDFFFKKKYADKKWYVAFFGAFSLTLITSAINPNYLTGAFYPFFVFHNYGYTIAENQTIFFIQSLGNDPAIVFFEIASLTLLTLLLINIRKTKPVEWLLALFFIYIGTQQIRNMPLFIFATFSFFVYYLDLAYNAFASHSFIQKNKYFGKIAVIILLCIAWIYEANLSISTKSFGFAINPQAQGAVNFFQAHHLQGPIFNNFDIGSYLIYTLYPKEKVFVDGRPEAYPAAFFQYMYKPMQESKENFAIVDGKYHFNTIVFAYTDATPWAHSFLSFIIKDPSWKMVYLDETMVILVKNTPTNQRVVNNHTLNEKLFLQHMAIQEKNLSKLFNFAVFLDALGWQQAETAALEKMLSENPTFCPALYQLARVYTEENNVALTTIYQTKFIQSCK